MGHGGPGVGFIQFLGYIRTYILYLDADINEEYVKTTDYVDFASGISVGIGPKGVLPIGGKRRLLLDITPSPWLRHTAAPTTSGYRPQASGGVRRRFPRLRVSSMPVGLEQSGHGCAVPRSRHAALVPRHSSHTQLPYSCGPFEAVVNPT